MPTLHAVVSGYVQGVGFRDYVRRNAKLMGITGEVWNRSDGAVELIAVHQESGNLEKLLQTLPMGPGVVEGIEHGYQPSIGSFETFAVGPSR